ncbi:MAG TPA: DUF4433 domain-containing protein [Stellaceae bacterium]|jgi:hypothetical protein
MAIDLTPQRALIFRITHRDNVPWIIQNGLHCRNSGVIDPNFVPIGNPELIERRRTQLVPVLPGGLLSDYVPFYFTPFSMMMYQIKTGFNGIRQRENEEIAIVVSSLHKLRERGVQYLFSDRHASLSSAEFTSDLDDLGKLDWPSWRNRDFKIDPEHPDKKERYQAEALAYQHVPVDALLGIVCYNDIATSSMKERLGNVGENVKVVTKRGWYF